jgi:BirA family biotin operon repressor/biotin-[acetyl-CoA-carboxylase] ligase
LNFPDVAKLVRLDVTTSTQDVAKRLASEGAPHGTVVWAGRQTKGRGQFDRTWESAEGGLYVSLLLRPRFDSSLLPKVSLGAAEAVTVACADFRADVKIKPPNDLMVKRFDKPHKLGGILVESSTTASRIDWLIIGLGLNVNNPVPESIPAVSLRQISGREYPLEKVLSRVLEELFRWQKSLQSL